MYFPVSNNFYTISIVSTYWNIYNHRTYTKSIFKMHISSQEYEYIYIYNIASTIAPAESQIPVRESSFIVHRDSALEFGREESLQRGKWLERGIESRSNPTEVVPRSSVRNSWGRKLQNWHRRRYVETDNRRCLTQWEATSLAVSLYTAV